MSTLVRGHWANLSTPSLLSLQSDLLLGILDILDPELFLRSCEQELQEQQQQQVQQPLPVPPTSLAALGAPSVKLEALNELIHFDHIYTKPVEEEEEEVVSSSSSSDSESDDKMDEVVVVVEQQQQEEVEVEVGGGGCLVCRGDAASWLHHTPSPRLPFIPPFLWRPVKDKERHSVPPPPLWPEMDLWL